MNKPEVHIRLIYLIVIIQIEETQKRTQKGIKTLFYEKLNVSFSEMRFLQNWNHLALQRSYAWSLVLYSLFLIRCWWLFSLLTVRRFLLSEEIQTEPYLFAVFEFGGGLLINDKTNLNNDKNIRN